jgi:hypothetical protein
VIAARAAALAHVVLDKPCPPERLQAAVEDAATARRDRPRPDQGTSARLWPATETRRPGRR